MQHVACACTTHYSTVEEKQGQRGERIEGKAIDELNMCDGIFKSSHRNLRNIGILNIGI
jgi:hypothetical protein